MKHNVRLLLLLACTTILSIANAQTIGEESLIMEKNIFIGVKGGVTAMDMQYSNDNSSFVNHSVLYQHPFQNLSNCLIGGVFVEGSIPRFSLGLEFSFHTMNAVANPDTTHYAMGDSAYFANIRIPFKVKFMENKPVFPYIFITPSIGTYVSDSLVGVGMMSYSTWAGEQVQWGTKNTSALHLSVIAGAGVEGKIPVGLYEVHVRFEAGYNLGILNMNPAELNFKRRMRGWEATLSVAFPLFLNPSYSWFN